MLSTQPNLIPAQPWFALKAMIIMVGFYQYFCTSDRV